MQIIANYSMGCIGIILPVLHKRVLSIKPLRFCYDLGLCVIITGS